MNSTHTPGPWFHIPRARDGHVDIITDRENNPERAFIHVGCPTGDSAIQTGNARLVLAAPDLLARLIEMTDLAERYGVGEHCDGNIIAAREAIAKATLPSKP